LSTLCLLPRTWISRSISIEYELRGVEMYEQFRLAIKTIKRMEKKQSHPLLSRLKEMLVDSIKLKKSTYEDLKKANSFLGIERQVDQLIVDFKEDNKKRSTLCREIILNFETVYKNWKPNIFTCYEHDFIPNDNNSLESNHNKIKRVLRKITGNKSTAQPLLVYGEEFVLAQSFFDKSPEEFLFALSEVDFELVAKKQKQLKVEQKKRGLKTKAVNQTKKLLKEAFDNW